MKNGKIKILLIEDDRAQAELIMETLAAERREQYSVQHVDYLAQGLDALKSDPFDCVLVDLGLPDSKGLDSALAVRREAVHLPLVVLTVLDDEEAALNALQMDIQDYLVKGEITPAILTRSIRYAMQRKSVAQRVSESEERLRFASEAAELSIWHWNPSTNDLVLDQRSKKFFGFSPEYEPTYHDVFQAIHPEDRERVEGALAGAVRERGEYSVEFRVLLPDGSIGWVLSRGRAYYDEQGNPLGMTGINMDISYRKKGEEALLLAKEEWERTFDTVPDLIAILDPGNRILRVNAAMAAMIGKKPEECIGLPCYAVFHGTDMPPQSCPHVKAVSESRQQITEVQQVGADTWFLVSYTPLVDGQGKPAGVVHVARDITERKLAERKIEQLNAELAARADELEAANRELEAFNYTAAHDLRQPLSVIDGNCQAIKMLCGTQIGQDCGGYLNEIRQGIKRMTQLLDALLNFSRMSRVEPQRATVDLSSIARGIAKEFRDTDSGRNATFQIADGVSVNGDPALMEIVLRNLIGNAWKYTGMQEGAVLIEFGVIKGGRGEVYFVRDNGPGFEMTDAEKLFAPFQRLPGTQSVRGFGIGLATVQRIIARHGGKIWAEGTPGEGATFYFTLN